MKKNQKPVAETAVNKATGTVVDIASLTPEQLLAIQKQIKAQRKADLGDHEQWVAIVDKMLHETEGDGFKYTTSDILSAVQEKAVVKVQLTANERAMQIKRIQTRKQLLEKKRDDKGNLLHKVGYKPSAMSFGPMSADRIIEWLQLEANMNLMTVKQAARIVELCSEKL